MTYSKTPVVVFLSLWLITNNVYAEGVFLTKKHASHELSDAEKRKINIEFLQKFGSQNSFSPATSSNPWQAKKQREQNQNESSVSWGECRDYALQQRNVCYKEGRQAYYCERYYEARAKKCNEDY